MPCCVVTCGTTNHIPLILGLICICLLSPLPVGSLSVSLSISDFVVPVDGGCSCLPSHLAGEFTKVGVLWELFWSQIPLKDHQGRSSATEVIEFEVSANDFSSSGMLPHLTPFNNPHTLLLCSQCHTWPEHSVAQPSSTSSNNGYGEAKYLLLF